MVIVVVLGCPSGCAGWLARLAWWEGFMFVRTLPLHVVIPSHFHSFPSRRRSISRQPTDRTWMALRSSRHSFLQGSLAVPRFFCGAHLSHLKPQHRITKTIGFPCCCSHGALGRHATPCC